MSNIGDIFLNIMMVITTIWTVNKYLNIFFERKSINIISVICWIVYFLFQLTVQINAGSGSKWTILLGIALVFVISCVNYYGTGKKKIFIVLFYYVIGSLLEMIVYFALSYFNMAGEIAIIFGQVISKILVIIVVYVISSYWQSDNNGNVPAKIYWALFFVPLGSIYVTIQLYYLMNENSKYIPAMISSGVLLLFNIVLFEIYTKLIKFFTIEKESALYVQQMEIISKYTDEQKKIMEDFHKEKHDLTNELIILKHNIEQNDFTAGMKNINEIIHSYDSKDNITRSGNTIVDAIINFKYAVASENQIKFDLKLFIPEELPFKQCDLGIIIGNAIDNAIEAVNKSKNQERKIIIVMGIKKQSFVMVIKNAFDDSIKKDKNGDLLSTKKDSNRHGYGVSSIKRVVEKYSGDVIIDTNDNVFTLIVTMSL